MRRGLSSGTEQSPHPTAPSAVTFPLESLQIPIANTSDCSKIPLNRHQAGRAGIYKAGWEGDYPGLTLHCSE